MLCKYKDIFGKPNQGVHSIRLFNIAIVDVVMTIIGAFFISKFLKTGFWFTLIFLFISGIIAHRVFCVETTINKILFSK